MIKKTKAQSIIEYFGLVLIISAAMSALFFYVQRALDYRVRHLNQELNEGQR